MEENAKIFEEYEEHEILEEVEENGETIEIIEAPIEMLFFEKPLNEYTTTEGLLLCLLLAVVLGIMINIVKGIFE